LPMLVSRRTFVPLSAALTVPVAAAASSRMLIAKYDLNCIIDSC
jgi:hypothetical protein